MRIVPLLWIASLLLITACSSQNPLQPRPNSIAFGSCLRQWQPQPVWQAVAELSPKAFIFMGDNVYNDVGPYLKQSPTQRLQQAYLDLAATDEFQTFLNRAKRQGIDLYAAWDDHDYGLNDAGAEFPYRAESKTYFTDFFNIDPNTSGSSKELGTYQNQSLEIAGLSIQLLLLDTRTYRSPLVNSEDKSLCPPTGRQPNEDPAATMLGEAQWHWLEEALTQPADVRLLVSSIQVLPTEHCFEKWANFPAERKRLLNLITRSEQPPLIILSGDRHLAEISRFETGQTAIYEVTSSGLNSAMGPISKGGKEINSLRQGPSNVLVNNFGSLEFEVEGENLNIQLQIRNEQGRILQQESLRYPR